MPFTYDDDEKSVQDALPADLYTITTPTTTYYLTSDVASHVVGGHTFAPAVIERDSVTMGTLGNGKEVTVKISLDHALAQDLLVGGVPQSGVLLEIDTLMQRSGATRMIHIGYITAISCDGTQVSLTVPSRMDMKINGVMLPVLVAQRICQHGLYDAGCTLNPASFQITPTLISVSGDGLTLTVSSISGKPDQWAQYGKITDGTGESRSVVSQIGTSIVIDVPFRTTSPGGTYTINAGCAHDVFTCRDKFANVVNYGGHPILPTVNFQSPTGIGVLVQS